MSQTLQKLRTMVQAPSDDVIPMPNAAAQAPNAGGNNGMEEQLVAIYSDIEYLNTNFPNHNIRSLVDYTKSLQSRMSSGASMQGDMGFVSADIVRKLGNLDAQSADAAPFGIVEVDDNGKVLLYNRWEAQLAGINQQSALGKNFFLEVAPCTNNRLFIGRFRQGMQTGVLDTSFNYTFTYKIKPTNVAIQMYRHPESRKNYIFVQLR